MAWITVTPEIARDRLAMRRRFNRASASFEHANFLHREIRERLLERLRMLKAARSDINPKTILDLGAAQGVLARELQTTFSNALVIALDFAELMLPPRAAWLKRLTSNTIAPVCADAQSLPLRDASIDLIASNGMLHCCLQPEAVLAETFAEIRRVLRPYGLFSFALFGNDTLRELRTAWSHIDTHTPVHPFIDIHNLGDFLVRAGFSDPVLDCETIKLTYSSFDTFMAELRAVGGTAWPPPSQRLGVGQGPGVGLGGRVRYRALRSAYEGLAPAESLSVTVDVIYGLAWQPHASPHKQRPGSRPGETLIPVDSLRSKR